MLIFCTKCSFVVLTIWYGEWIVAYRVRIVMLYRACNISSLGYI